ncbi:AMP-binding protein [Dactylosporangium sp. CA-092794]|uniref:AMP-binding protein n=1 Tax=Dactylosporangium sp. CA-092794 TaxID=3239929 RepID=UPI003D8A8333
MDSQWETVWDVLLHRAEETPDGLIAVDEHGRRLTFAQLRDEAEAVAAHLVTLGVGQDTVVSWQLPTRVESMILMAALTRLGALQNPIVPISREREVGFMVEQLRTRLLVVPTVVRGFDHAAMARGLRARNPELDVLVLEDRLPRGDPAVLPPPPPRPAGFAGYPVRWVLYSSGSTSDPKGARHTDGSVLTMGRNLIGRLELTPDDRVAMVSPFAHIGGMTWFVISLLAGSANILTERFNDEAIAVLSREGVTIAGTTTPFHEAYLKAQLASPARIFPNVRAFPGGGATRSMDLHRRLKAAFGGVGVVSGYGSTETGPLTIPSIHDDDLILGETEGRPYDTTEIRIVRADGSLAAVGESGEVCAKGPQMMLGYVDPALDSAFDRDGFFHTGDLGSLDAEGNLRITGRLKDIIIRKGENISSQEVQELLALHPSIEDVAVIGMPDPEVGEMCCAVAVLAPGVASLTLADVKEFLLGKGLAVQKVPERLVFAESLPRTDTGKIMRHLLRERLAQGKDDDAPQS